MHKINKQCIKSQKFCAEHYFKGPGVFAEAWFGSHRSPAEKAVQTRSGLPGPALKKC
jgi:hypothetical protein